MVQSLNMASQTQLHPAIKQAGYSRCEKAQQADVSFNAIKKRDIPHALFGGTISLVALVASMVLGIATYGDIAKNGIAMPDFHSFDGFKAGVGKMGNTIGLAAIALAGLAVSIGVFLELRKDLKSHK